MSNQTATFDTIRTLGHASISGSYAALGAPLTSQVRIFVITNTSDDDLLFSLDGTHDMMIVPKATSREYNLTTNKILNSSIWCLPPGTQFYVKFVTSISTGSVYLECIS